MEYSKTILSSEYLNVVQEKVNGVWRWRPELLESFNGMPPVIINKHFYNFIDPTKEEFHARHQLLWGGSGSGKSRFIQTKFLLIARNEAFFRLFYVRKEFASLKASVYQNFKDTISFYGWDKYFRCFDSTYEIVNLETGNQLIPKGLDRMSKLRSIADPTDIWIEEGVADNINDCVTSKEYGELNRRLRTMKAENHLHSTFNPINKNSFYYTDFFKELKYKGVAFNHSTADINPFLEDSYIDTLEESKAIDEEGYEVFRHGLWSDGKRDGKWLRHFKDFKHKGRVKYIKDQPVHFTFDFNVKPYMTGLCAQMVRVDRVKVDPKTRIAQKRDVIQVRIFKEYCLKNPLNTAEAVAKKFISEYIDVYGFNTVYYYGDASGKNRIPGFGDLRAFDPIKNALAKYIGHSFANKTLRANVPIVLARELTDNILGEKFDIEIIIDSRCENLLNDCRALEETPTGFDPKKDKEGTETVGHCYQALTYLLCSAFNQLIKFR